MSKRKETVQSLRTNTSKKAKYSEEHALESEPEPAMDNQTAFQKLKDILCEPKSEYALSNKAKRLMPTVLNNLANLAKPLAITLDERYTHEILQTKGAKALKGIDAQRYKLIKSAFGSAENPLCIFIAKAVLTHHQNVNEIDCNDRRRYNKATILTSNEEEEIPTENEDYDEYEKTKLIENWYDLEGNSIFREKVDVPVETFFVKVFDFFNDDPSEKIDSWRFLSRQKSKKFCMTITTTYEKHLLAFWPKTCETSVFDELASTTANESSQSESEQSQEVSENTENNSDSFTE